MLLTRWDPFLANRPLRDFAVTPPTWPGLAVSYPPVTVWEDADNVYVEAELLGVTRDQLDITITHGNQLTLKGQRVPGADGGTWHRRERGFGTFGRLLVLPVPVEADGVEARLENGVLTVTLPKSASARPRRITVKAE